ncbi:uncharacterized protein LOC108734440 [Agrilus planipennis]|uniref:Uncharacterized protein LOC108734440 n=1 Tax=Agrilus planipennis TaxID=224129 RepID=A0A1W4WN89_AGRPL|nr:uncharacterized protein LOC108734440 [Agrilus planipennis]XP_025831135.1 uncharacterized protein LOC108734440 [Agrilus planipennis]
MMSTSTFRITLQNNLQRLVPSSSTSSAILFNRTMSNTTLINADTPIISLDEVKRFIVDCMKAVGTPENHASELAELLADADYRGHYSHGMNRLDIYMNDIKSGVCDPNAVPTILKENDCTAWVDGCNGIGAVVSNFCMKLAIKKAKQSGIGWVTCKGSNHFGIAGHYTMQAQREGLLGFACTNTSPFMAPTRAKQPALGTNPISLAVPSSGKEGMVLDMATTAVAVGKIEIQRRKEAPLPLGWAMDENGQETSDPNKARFLYPLGGTEMNSGYKGYGLGILVEVFCGILGGGQFATNIRKWGDTTKTANLGHSFFALNPNCFASDFESRMQNLSDILRNCQRVNPNEPVLIPGDPEIMHMAAVDKAGGVRYLQNQMESCKTLAATYNVTPLKPKD